MTVTNGRANEYEFSDMELSTSSSDAGNPRAAKGPWTHSTDSYTRSPPQLPTTKDSRTKLCIAGVAFAVVFIIGLGLGMVIGSFAIQSCDQNSGGHVGASSGLADPRNARTTMSTTTPASSSTTQCVCTTPPKSTIKPECSACATRNPDVSTGNEHMTSPFAALSRDEIDKATSVMVNSGNASYGRGLYHNRISHVYLYPNNKHKVLNYLDRGGEFPGRFAKVHVYRGSQDPPDVMEYKVGPLHESDENITIEQLRQDGEINFNRRPYDEQEGSIMHYLAKSHMNDIRTLLTESFDGLYFNHGIRPGFAFMPAYNESSRASMIFLYTAMSGYNTIRILPVTCTVYHPGTDRTQWRFTEFYYLSQGPFDSAQELQAAYDNGTLRKVAFPTGYTEKHNDEWLLQLNTSMPPRPLSDIPPPRTFEPRGPRYTINGSHVAWMDWQLEFTSDAIRGPAVYDVRFKGDRIAYEISLQDVTLLYASQSSGSGPPVISDTIFHLGNSNPPRLGLDCPSRAALIRLSMNVFGRTLTKPYACVFEADGQDSSWKFQGFGLSKHYLVIRSMMNLGNYEYSVEWRLHLDGHLETMISASGFLYGAFWDKDDPLVDSDKSSTPFGYRLSEYLSGPIHDHAYVFKVDVDVLGESNSMEILHWKTGDVLSALNTQTNTSEVPGYFPFNNTRYIDYELLENETGFILDPLKPKYFTIVNENEKNMWGVKRGYRLIPHSMGAENFDDHVMFGPWGHLKHNIAVTRRKETEPYATNSMYDLYQPLNAFKGVATMLDNETARNEDLVLWVTEKFYHAPSAEDVPMTLKVQRGFTLTPYNYFDRTPTFDVRGYYVNTQGDPYTVDPCYISNT